MNSFFFMMLLGVVACASARPVVPVNHHVAKKQSTGQDVLQFLEGFVTGLEVEVGNLTECTKDIDISLDDFDVSFAMISRGFHRLSVSDVEKGIRELGVGIEEVAKAFNPCGLPELAKDIETLAKQLQAGVLGIVKVIAEETLDILSNQHALTGFFHGAVDNWKSGNFRFSGLNVGKIVGILLEGVKTLKLK